MKMAAIYARVSSEQQREEHTIASQTAALIEFAKSHDLEVPKEWVFEDEGYSGATLERPGLERVRDLAAEGQIQVVLAYAPDRLSRKYAYQILLIEEFARHGVETLFVKAPQSATAEDQLLVQFQGMIAEYERAQILERSRRGKRHRARAGEVSVLSGAPYGYRYIRKTDEAPASYAVIDAEARVVQRVYEMYTVEGLSIGEIARRLNAEGIPTRKQSARWERSVVWAMLRNPAYRGAACFGKTRVAARIRVTRALRRRGGIVSSEQCRPRACARGVDRDPGAGAGERGELRARAGTAPREQNTIAAPHDHAEHRAGLGQLPKVRLRLLAHLDLHERAQDPLLQMHRLGQLAKTGRPRVRQRPHGAPGSAGSDRLGRGDPIARGPDADPAGTRPPSRRGTRVRSDEATRAELAERTARVSARASNDFSPPIRRNSCRSSNCASECPRCVSASKRCAPNCKRSPTRLNDRATFLRLAETLAAFLARLRSAADTLDVIERQRIVRLVVKEILIGDDTIVIRHCIPVASTPPPDGGPPTPESTPKARQAAKVTFCVRGVMTPPCGTPCLPEAFSITFSRRITSASLTRRATFAATNRAAPCQSRPAGRSRGRASSAGLLPRPLA